MSAVYCPGCKTLFAWRGEKCPVCGNTDSPLSHTTPIVPIFPMGDSCFPQIVGVRGGCQMCSVTHSEYEIDSHRYCKACFDRRFTLVEKTATA